MSQIIKKMLDGEVSIEELTKGFELIAVHIEPEGEVRLYGRNQDVDLHVPGSSLVAMGFEANTHYGEQYGIGINQKGEQVELVYDGHYIPENSEELADYLPGIGQIGARADHLNALEAQGYTLEPLLDMQNGELQLNISGANTSGSMAWADSDGGAW